MTLVVFDLDGTLANIEHRLHFIGGDQKDWRSFFAACVDDEPNLPVIDTLFAHMRMYHRVEIWSGRSDEVEAETRDWLDREGINPEILTRMRPAGNHMPDVDLKRGWLREDRPYIVYEDRKRLAAMWREEGVACFQVAPGEF